MTDMTQEVIDAEVVSEKIEPEHKPGEFYWASFITGVDEEFVLTAALGGRGIVRYNLEQVQGDFLWQRFGSSSLWVTFEGDSTQLQAQKSLKFTIAGPEHTGKMFRVRNMGWTYINVDQAIDACTGDWRPKPQCASLVPAYAKKVQMSYTALYVWLRNGDRFVFRIDKANTACRQLGGSFLEDAFGDSVLDSVALPDDVYDGIVPLGGMRVKVLGEHIPFKAFYLNNVVSYAWIRTDQPIEEVQDPHDGWTV